MIDVVRVRVVDGGACGSTSMFPKQRNGSASAADDAAGRGARRPALRSSCPGRRRRPSRGRRTARTGSQATSRAPRRVRRVAWPERSPDPLLHRSSHFCPECMQSVSGCILRVARTLRRNDQSTEAMMDVAAGPEHRRVTGIDAEAIGALRAAVDGEVIVARRSRLRRRPSRLERDDRPPTRRDRALPGDGRRGRRGHLRPRARPARVRPRWRAQRRGHAVADGGVMIDLSPMHAVRVDPEQRPRLRRGRRHVGAPSTGRPRSSGSPRPAG